MWNKIQSGTFRFSSYCTRKIQRIYPSLVAVVVFTLLCTFFLFSGSEFAKVLETAKTALLGYSNVYIDSISSNYFLTALDEQPLLHTWYLSVTLQAYLLFPVLLLIIDRVVKAEQRKTVLILSLGILTAVSFVIFYWDYIQYGAHKLLGTYWNTSNPHPYYWTTGRIWEFTAGALIPYLPNIKWKWISELLVALSLFVIIFLCSYTALPALCGVVVVAATMIVVRYAPATVFGDKCLSLKLLLGLGTISFSLYLWHLPIISLVSYIGLVLTPHIPLWAHVLTGLSCLLLSVAAYHVIERKKTMGAVSKVAYSSLFVLIISVGFVWPHYAHLFENEAGDRYTEWTYETDENIVKGFPDSMRGMRGFYGEYPVVDGYQPPAEEGKFVPAAHIGVPGTPPNFVLLGDSHANHLFPALDRFAKEEGYSGIYVSRYVTPFVGLDFGTRYFEFKPDSLNDLIEWLRNHPEIDTVIIGQRWHSRFLAARDTEGNWHQSSEQPHLSSSALRGFLELLKAQGKKVVVVGPLPECPCDRPAKYVARCHHLNVPIDSSELLITKESFDAKSAAIVRELRALEELGLCRVVYPHEKIFKKDFFDARVGDTAMFSDTDHLSLSGAQYILSLIKDDIFRYLKRVR